MIRKTKETEIEVLWTPRGSREIQINTGVGFLDHMLECWAFHGGFDLKLEAIGDLSVDPHHTVEDTAIALGETMAEELGDRSGLARFGWAYAPLDEALSRAVVDLVQRPFCRLGLPALPQALGTIPGEMVGHFFRSLAFAGRFTLHLDVLAGDNGHHVAESAFKALGLSLAAALQPAGSVPASTKGVL